MKRIYLTIIVLCLPMLLIACTDTTQEDTDQEEIVDDNTAQDESIENNEESDESENETDDIEDQTDDMQQQMEELDYSKFELEVKYSDGSEYEAEIEHGDHGIKADLEDELNNVDLNGEDAFNEIYPNVQKLSIDQDTKKEDAIKEVIDAFNLDPDYINFELEITFSDGTEIEYEDKKDQS